MFFVLRCIFWLSLVFTHLPAGEGSGNAASLFLDMAGRHVDAFARQSLASAADKGATWCRANGEACASAVLAAMRTKAEMGLRRSDTLTAADRSLAPGVVRTRG